MMFVLLLKVIYFNKLLSCGIIPVHYRSLSVAYSIDHFPSVNGRMFFIDPKFISNSNYICLLKIKIAIANSAICIS